MLPTFETKILIFRIWDFPKGVKLVRSKRNKEQISMSSLMNLERKLGICGNLRSFGIMISPVDFDCANWLDSLYVVYGFVSGLHLYTVDKHFKQEKYF